MSAHRILPVVLALMMFTPATASAALFAAYDRYVPGKGFEIGLVNLSTGSNVSLPAGVNTAADELHPALSANGRFLWFARTQLQPALDGNVIPPAQRSLVRLDRSDNSVTVLPGNAGFGVTFSDFGRPGIAYGEPIVPRPETPGTFQYGRSTIIDPATGGETGEPVERVALTAPSLLSGPNIDQVETTQAGLGWTADGGIGRQLIAVAGFRNDGLFVDSMFRVDAFGPARNAVVTGSASHPAARPGDGYIAYQKSYGFAAQINAFTFPNAPGSVAPAPITTSLHEGMPAWSPDLGKYLGFVRVKDARRTLLAFDTTPGIQDALNTPVDIGSEAPTAQLRRFQEVFGSIALANVITLTSPTFQSVCNACVVSSGPAVALKPSLSTSSAVGILVARITGKRSLLGRTVPRIKPVGRVPLGKARKGGNRFLWDGRVDGKRLRPGRYLLTFRALKGDRITATSDSVRFTVTAKGRPKGFTPLR